MEILFYSKYSKACELFYNAISKIIDINSINLICIDNADLREKILNSKYKFDKVPCIMKFDKNVCEIYEGKQAWEIFNLEDSLEEKVVNKEVDDTSLKQDTEPLSSQNLALDGNESYRNATHLRAINSNKESATDISLRLKKEAEEFNKQFVDVGHAPLTNIPSYSTETAKLATDIPDNVNLRPIANKKKESASEIAARLSKEAEEYERNFQRIK
jgi:hypothetical protein